MPVQFAGQYSKDHMIIVISNIAALNVLQRGIELHGETPKPDSEQSMDMAMGKYSHVRHRSRKRNRSEIANVQDTMNV